MRKLTNLYRSKGQNGNVYDWNGRSPTILSGVTDNSNNGGIGSNNSPKLITKDVDTMNEKRFRIRKLTPEECFILQGMKVEDVDKCRNVDMSNTQLYKQAGNGLTTNCVQFLMEHLYKCLYNENYKTTDEMMSEKYGGC